MEMNTEKTISKFQRVTKTYDTNSRLPVLPGAKI